MTPLSSKFAGLVAVSCALASVPIWFHLAESPIEETCPGVETFLAADRIGEGVVAQRGTLPKTGEDFIEGKLATLAPRVSFMKFRVVRGFDPASFFRPDLLTSFGENQFREFDAEMLYLDADGQSVPVHWVANRIGSHLWFRGVFYVYEGRPVASPLVAGIRSGGEQIFSGTRPFTVFMIISLGRDAKEELMVESTQAWLLDAWRAYRDACSP